MNKQKYHYTECGLDNVYLVNGFSISKDGNEEVILINDIHGLHQAIGIHIANKTGLLKGKEIKFIRTMFDVSPKTLGLMLGYDYQTILAWEKNKSPISVTADHFLKVLFMNYLDVESGKEIYGKINELADLDAEITESNCDKIQFEEVSDRWRVVEAA